MFDENCFRNEAQTGKLQNKLNDGVGRGKRAERNRGSAWKEFQSVYLTTLRMVAV